MDAFQITLLCLGLAGWAVAGFAVGRVQTRISQKLATAENLRLALARSESRARAVREARRLARESDAYPFAVVHGLSDPDDDGDTSTNSHRDDDNDGPGFRSFGRFDGSDAVHRPHRRAGAHLDDSRRNPLGANASALMLRSVDLSRDC